MGATTRAACPAVLAAAAVAAAACAHRPPAADDTIGCRGPAVLVVENGTAQNLDVIWYARTLGVAYARATTRIQAPAGFPCTAAGDCRSPEFRNQNGTLPEPGPFHQTFSYYIECH
jgi:non-ribosomal peptide synthetase component E (peptide arylation enzyme)